MMMMMMMMMSAIVIVMVKVRKHCDYKDSYCDVQHVDED